MNENGVAQISLKWSGRLITEPDGRTTFRAVCIGAYPGGDREVCTFEVKTWEGGVEMLRSCVPNAAQLAVSLCTRQLSGLLVAKV